MDTRSLLFELPLETLTSVIKDFGIGSMIPSMFFVLFWIADKNLHPRLRKQFSAFLLAKNVSPNIQYVAASFIDMMNVTFGQIGRAHV